MVKRANRTRATRAHTTITGKRVIPKVLKPQKARFTIRRFHTLHKYRASLTERLKSTTTFKQGDETLSIDNYKEFMRSKIRIWKIYQAKYEQTRRDNKVDIDLSKVNTFTEEDVVSWLGVIDAEEKRLGGLESYQMASTMGQDSNRGGDSSKRLIEWMQEVDGPYSKKLGVELRALEIGCLSVSNKISTSRVFKEVVKIDLNSQHPHIKKQDFMSLPIPESNDKKFNLVSCSLVLNFVPTAPKRGEMLKRITQFLKPPVEDSLSALFVVLPLPCVKNSRYMDSQHFLSLMDSLGFHQTYYEETSKLAYWLFDWKRRTNVKKLEFPKKQIHEGAKRNNFAIVLE